MVYGDRYVETPEQQNKTRLIIALQQVDNIIELTKDNPWKNHLYNHLSPIKYELERQLSLPD